VRTAGSIGARCPTPTRTPWPSPRRGRSSAARSARRCTSCSDDGWSDFCDAVPLAGEAFCKRALATKKREGFLDEEEVLDAIKAACREWVDNHSENDEPVEKRLEKAEKWFKLIRHGENYVHTALEDGVKNFYLSVVRDSLSEEDQEKLSSLDC
jgi:tRNA-dihydrouridine synthase